MGTALEKMKDINDVVAYVVKDLNDSLAGQDIFFYESFQYKPIMPTTGKSNVYIGIENIAIGTNGSFGEYRVMDLTLGINIFSGKELGACSARKAFGEIAEAFLKSELAFYGISMKEIKYDKNSHAIRLDAKADMKMLIKADDEIGAGFTGFELKGRYTL